MESASKSPMEREILAYWEKKKIFAQLRKRNAPHKSWSFLDGPITANNPMGVHHAWGRTLKDLYQRYKAMQGYDQRYQNGFDCQGLWLEVETEKSLGFNSKKDIENYGLDRFSKACRARVDEFSAVQTEQSKLLGQWMDWGKDYFTMSDANIQAIWFFLKKCEEKGLLYKGRRSLPWCIRCGTSSSKHEMSDDGYAELVHPSVYARAKIVGRKNEYLLLWTTTEWTLSSNIAAAVNPAVMYVQAKKGEDVYYLSEALVHKLKKDYSILKKIKGKELVGLEYEAFYPEFEVQKGVVHKVVAWDEVGEKDGTGIVHIAPNCGEEDYQLAKKLGLKILEPTLDEFGNYNKGFGWLTGKNVGRIKKEIVEDLEKRGLLFAVEQYKHRYPICWRCKHELVFRLDSSWFIACDPVRAQMKKEAAKVEWYPEHVGKLMQDWLDNMEDWNISRRRYWGLPLMFYECGKCKHTTVIGSLKELREKAVDKKAVDALPELHRPWIDAVKITCSCGEIVHRITDVGDCWLDAGIVPFSTLHYFDDQTYWKKWFPAELEIEMRAQVRLWFYAQLFMSVVLVGKAPYKRVLAYEEVRDEKGKPMHKSSGNAIWFDDAVEKMGTDVMRWQYCIQNPQFNVNFGYGPAKEVQRHLFIIHNLARYVKENCVKRAKSYSTDPASAWILSRRERLVQDVTASLDALEYHKAMESLKNYLLFDLSKTYVQFIRDDLDDAKVQKGLYDCYLTGITLLAPFLPFTAEKINLDLFAEESIHLQEWPKVQKKYLKEALEEGMQNSLDILQMLMAARDKEKVNVRWPLQKAEVHVQKEFDVKNLKDFVPLLLKQANLKELVFVAAKKESNIEMHVVLDLKQTPALEAEGFSREIMRRVQALRKEAGLQREDSIVLSVFVEGVDLFVWKKHIAERCGAKKISFVKAEKMKHHSEGDIKEKKFFIGFDVL
ncbi:isoleucine--tRNA ligase [Candidatus Woesearchaeota archaeon]|nr:isoleucine--tRNA ligase [Candidatus Woesearchaeota archaeon]